MYATGATLKFPVVQKIHDKPSVEINTLKDLHDTQVRSLQKKNKDGENAVNRTPRKTTMKMAKV